MKHLLLSSFVFCAALPAVAQEEQKPPAKKPPAEKADKEQDGPKVVRPKGRRVHPTDRAIRRGLAWLARHQGANGSWSAESFHTHCPAADTCDGTGKRVHDVGVTGLAVLAFLGTGSTTRNGSYKDAVKRAIDWLVNQQGENGLIGVRAGHAYQYGHAIASWALIEAYGLSRSTTLEKPAQRAANYIKAARNPYRVWRYTPRDGDNDSSMTGWMSLALAAARDHGLKYDKQGLTFAYHWYEQVTEPETGRVGYTKRGEGSARTVKQARLFPTDMTEPLTAIGITVRLLADRREPILKKAAATILAKPPAWRTDGSIDYYYWFHGSLAFHRLGEPYFQRWKMHLESLLVSKQTAKGHATGSWDPVDAWSDEGGRIYSTALAIATLSTLRKKNRLLR